MREPSWAERRAYAQEALLLNSTIRNGTVYPTWVDDSNFWYERHGGEGFEYCVVDAKTGDRSPIVTRVALALMLATFYGAPVGPDVLIVRNPRFDLVRRIFSFEAFGDAFEFVVGDSAVVKVDLQVSPNWVRSPDGSLAVLLRDANLVLRDANGGERPLTTDGTAYYAYGAMPAAARGIRARAGAPKPEAIWSPDGRWILTIQADDREVKDLPLADYAPDEGVRPRLIDSRVGLPGDPCVTQFRMLAIERETGRQVEARYPRVPAVRMNTSPITAGLCWWSVDSKTAYFVDIERGEQRAHVVAFDVASGSTRVVFSEESESYVEVSVDVYTHALIAPLPETNEVVWYSERDGNGHLYLYDLATGAMRNAITAGPWRVREVLSVDAKRREIVFMAGGIADGEDPYVRKPCVASLDSPDVRILSDALGDHIIHRAGQLSLAIKKLEGLDTDQINGRSPSGDFFVETVSSVTELPKTWLRRRDGGDAILLETAEGELPVGWRAPEPVTCKAADGVTDVYGLLFKPLGFDEAGSYPLVDYIYGGPQTANVPHASFASGDVLQESSFLEGAHLAALGAFVLILDGRGSAYRERAFRTASWRAAQTASNLEDHVAAAHQLAEVHPQIDLSRVGITGFSGGGYMAAHAALRFGDFYKVAVAGGGNYDQALFWHTWGERYHGPFGADHYATQAAKTYAEGLSGKLMLVHGLRDEGCHPAAMFQLVQALIQANKDVDLVVLPRGGHEWTGYGLRRRWDYFVTNLMGATSPPSAAFRLSHELLIARIAANGSVPKAEAAKEEE